MTIATKTRAAVFYGPGQVSLADKELPGDGSVLKIKSCCVCGYDSRVFRNGHRKVKPPMVLGHEICAETAVDLGPVKAGTRVAVYPVKPCLSCRYCRQGRYNLCTDIKELGSTIDGGFAEYINVPQEIIKIGGLVPVPDSLGDEEASLIEPLACCLNGFSQINGTIEKEGAVAIIGDGPVGLLHLQLSKNLLGARTAVIGKVPARMDIAESLGADRVFSAHEVSEMLAFTEGAGYELVIVAASEPSALDLATRIAAKGSRISIFAGIKDSPMLDPNLVHYNQISISGSFSSTPDNFRQAASLAGRRIVDLSRIVTHRYALDEIGEALITTESYRGLRAAVIP